MGEGVYTAMGEVSLETPECTRFPLQRILRGNRRRK